MIEMIARFRRPALMITIALVVALVTLGWFWPRTEADLNRTVYRCGLDFRIEPTAFFVIALGTITAILFGLGLLLMVSSYLDRISYTVLFFLGLAFSCGFFPFPSYYFFILLCGAVGLFVECLWRGRWPEGLILASLAAGCGVLILLLRIVAQSFPTA
jgi:hypothetical protein